MFEQTITIPAAFGAGLLSFFSPCIIPLLPAYFSFITGVSIEELLEREKDSALKKQIILSTLMFISGFTLVFVLMGFSATAAGGLFSKFGNYLRIIGGTVVIILGLHLTGIIQLRFLQMEKRIELKQKPVHLIGSFFAGNAFAAGWTPCIGPILGSILVIASSQETMTQGGFLLLIYSLGLAVPFFILSFFIHFLLSFMQKTRKFIRFLNVFAGVFLILLGIVLIADKLGQISNFFL
ncbi:MAG: cytochrome c biogenesis protein CcdA [Desulforegulaceae bacterium]|nr:cytochrome c biogenesis protein CcdA [Desulforegulaceae bacterium]